MNKAFRSGPSRRFFLESLAAGLTLAAPARAAEPPADHGRIDPPLPAPDMKIVRHDGAVTTLPKLMNHRATALQLMFTSCTTTCPIQGAIFAHVQKLLPDQGARGIQLVSLSVDPQHDTPAILAEWLHRFHGRAGWTAGAPDGGDVERLRDFAGRGRNPADNHSTQVQILNRAGKLVWRTGQLPAAEEIASILRKI